MAMIVMTYSDSRWEWSIRSSSQHLIHLLFILNAVASLSGHRIFFSIM
ncbi:hypothetical protein [Rubritalea tangerina]